MNNSDKNPFEEIKRVRMTDAEKLGMRQKIVDHVKNNPLSEASTSNTHVPEVNYFSLFFKSQRVLASFVVLAGLIGLLSISENARPGDVLYPVKIYLSDPINSVFGGKTDSDSNIDVEEELLPVNTFYQDEYNQVSATEEGDQTSLKATTEIRTLESEEAPMQSSSDLDDVNNLDPKSASMTTAPATGGFLLMPECIECDPVEEEYSPIKSVELIEPESGSIQYLGSGNTLKVKWNKLEGSSKLNLEIYGPIDTKWAEPVLYEIDINNKQGEYIWELPVDAYPGRYSILIRYWDENLEHENFVRVHVMFLP